MPPASGPCGLRRPGGSLDAERRTSGSALSAGRDVAALVGVVAVVQGMPVLGQLLSARYLDSSDFGQVRVAEAVIGLMLTLSSAGLTSTMIRYVGEARDEAVRQAILRRLLWIGPALAAALGVLVTLLVPLTPLTPASAATVRLVVWAAVPASVTRLVIGFHQGERAAVRALRTALIGAAIWVVCLVIGLAGGSIRTWGVGRLAGEFLAATVVAAVFLRVRRSGSGGGALPPGIVGYAGFVSLSLILDRGTSSVDTFLLDGLLGDLDAVAQVGVATTIANAALLVPAGLGAYALPRLARAAGDPTKFRTLASGLALWYLAAIAVPVIGLVGWGPGVVRLIVGPTYSEAGALARLFGIVLLGNGLLSFGGLLLLAANRPRMALLQSGAGLVASLAANWALIPSWGARGAAMAAIIVVAVRMLILGPAAFRVLRTGDGT